MGHREEPSKLSAAPVSDDIEFVTNHFKERCNCYSYAVQDYLAGDLSEHDEKDFHFLPRPGQTRGRTYQDLWLSPEGMRRAIHEDGIDFAGMKYPKRIPKGYYVICCFLEPNEYHFIRQNRDGSWSSKDGRNSPTKLDSKGEPLTNPENFYQGQKEYQFVGYFFVPEGGIRTGARGYETRRLEELKEHTKNPKEESEKRMLERLVELSDFGDETVQKMRELYAKKGISAELGARQAIETWDLYARRFSEMSRLCYRAGYTRCSVLKDGYTRPKNARCHSDSR